MDGQAGKLAKNDSHYILPVSFIHKRASDPSPANRAEPGVRHVFSH
jgi:hypothetical protein